MLRRAFATGFLLLAVFACRESSVTQSSPPPQEPQVPFTQYKLTFTASPSCSLPPEATTLTFPAWISEPTPGTVAVDLYTHFPCFCSPGFDGTRNGDAYSFVMLGGLGDTLVGELIAGDREVDYDGTAVATRTDNTITGTFNGKINVIDSASGTVVASCDAKDHKIEFKQ